MRRVRLSLCGVLGPMGLALVALADWLGDIPPGVEARHYIPPPELTYYDD